jgi:hypothetical protein
MTIWGDFGEIHNHQWTNGLTVRLRVQAPDNRIYTLYIFTYSDPQPPIIEKEQYHHSSITLDKVGQGQAGQRETLCFHLRPIASKV